MTNDLDPSPGLVREWAACGIVAAVSRFVPVPLLDDVVKERATRLALARTLTLHQRDYPVTDVEVLYTGTDGWFSGAAKYAVKIPSRVVLFPVRKYVAVFGAVKGVPADVMAVVLLARTMHRSLARGGLSSADPQAVGREAKQLRKAYDSAFDEMDLRLLVAGLSDALSTGKGLTGAASEFAQRMIDRLPGRSDDHETTTTGDETATTGGGTGADDGEVVDDLDPELKQGAEEVGQVFRRPEITALLAEFDRRVDAYLGIPA